MPIIRWLSRLYSSHVKILLPQEVYNEVEANRPKVEAVLQQGQEYLRRQDKPNPSSQLTQNLKNLKSRWDNITVR